MVAGEPQTYFRSSLLSPSGRVKLKPKKPDALADFRYGNPNASQGYFGEKSHSHPRLVKQR